MWHLHSRAEGFGWKMSLIREHPETTRFSRGGGSKKFQKKTCSLIWIEPREGRGGQKIPKIEPHGFWMPPNQKNQNCNFNIFSGMTRSSSRTKKWSVLFGRNTKTSKGSKIRTRRMIPRRGGLCPVSKVNNKYSVSHLITRWRYITAQIKTFY